MALFACLEKRVRAGKFCARSAMGWDWRILSTTALKKYAPPRWITWISQRVYRMPVTCRLHCRNALLTILKTAKKIPSSSDFLIFQSIQPTRWFAARYRCKRRARPKRRGAYRCHLLCLKDGDSVRIHQGACSATMFAERDARLPDNVVRIPAAAPASAQLGGLFGKIRVEKA